ncbi:MAG: putative HTH transcriptional regulator [Roseivirga sp.]|jgi:predicted HTH transcriptional regulator
MDWELHKHNRHLEIAKGDNRELYRLIREGEHQQQDFKFRVDSSVKIARTLSSFANCEGGTLLIGVKDNGKITGINPEEEYYMIEGAAELYCEPKVKFSYQLYDIEEKFVIAIYIERSNDRPHFVKEDQNKKLAYIRQADENFVANRVLLRYLRDRNSNSEKKNMVAYGPAERSLFDYLSKNDDVSVSKFSRLAKIPLNKAEQILALFLKWEVIGFEAGENGIRFFLFESD